MSTDYQSQLQKVESDIQSLEAIKKELEQKIAAEQRSENAKRYHQLVDDITKLVPEFRKHEYELTLGDLDNMFYSIEIALEHPESGCAFVYSTISGLDDALKVLPALQHILRTSCRSLDTVVAIAQRVYEVYEFQKGALQRPFKITYTGDGTSPSDTLLLGFIYHGSYHGKSKDINIQMNFSDDDYQPIELSIDTELSESESMTTIGIPQFPYDLDISVSNLYDTEAYAKVQLSHFELVDPKNPGLIDETVDTIRDFARTAEKLDITSRQQGGVNR